METLETLRSNVARVLVIQCFPAVEFPVHPQFALQAGLAGKDPQVKFKHFLLLSYSPN